MTLVQQNTSTLNNCIQSYGCRFRCLQAIAEMEEKKSLTALQISECYRKLIQDSSIMTMNCLCGYQEHLIIKMVFTLLGNTKKTCRQVGSMQNHVPIGWDKKICNFDYMILHWRTHTLDGHYTLADKDGKEIFDPWDNCNNDMEKMHIQRTLLYKIKGRDYF